MRYRVIPFRNVQPKQGKTGLVFISERQTLMLWDPVASCWPTVATLIGLCPSIRTRGENNFVAPLSKQYLLIIKEFLSFAVNPGFMGQNIAAGLLMYRVSNGILQYFLVHPGGPYFKAKDQGVWSIPKGIPEDEEDLIATACREFFEETGIHPAPPFHELGTIKQKAGKVVYAWAFSGSWNPESGITCNSFSLEWPPRSGKMMEFPEVDRARWMDYTEAAKMINPAQISFLDRAREIYNK